MRPVLPNSARCEKKRVVSHAVHPSTMLMCSARNPASCKLTTVGLDQVEVQFGTKLAVAGRSRCQKQHRIANVNGVRVEDLFEEIAAVRKLRIELGAHLGADLITAAPDGRPDSGAQITRLAAKLPSHLAHALLHDAGHGSAPSRMKCADHSPLHVSHQYGNAIGSLDRQQQSGRAGDDPVTRERLVRRRAHRMNHRRVHLLHLHQRPHAAGVFTAPSASRNILRLRATFSLLSAGVRPRFKLRPP